MKQVRSIIMLLRKSGTLIINYYLPTRTKATQLNAPFASSRPNFSLYSRVLLQISQEICGTFYSLKLN